MEHIWSPGCMVTAEMRGSEVFVSEAEFRRGWSLPARRGASSELVPLLQLVEEVDGAVNARVSTAFEVFRGVARAAAKVHPAIQPVIYASIPGSVRSSSRTTRMVRVLELQSLIHAYCVAKAVVIKKAKRYFFSRFGKESIGQLEVHELEALIEQITDELAR